MLTMHAHVKYNYHFLHVQVVFNTLTIVYLHHRLEYG